MIELDESMLREFTLEEVKNFCKPSQIVVISEFNAVQKNRFSGYLFKKNLL